METINVSESRFINSKHDLKEFLEYERLIYGRKSRRMPILCLGERSYLWKYIVLLRKTEYYVNAGKKVMGLIFRALLSQYQNKHQIHIPINTFDKGLQLMHLGPILVNGNVKGGKDIILHINTGLVAGGTNNEVPVLEDGVIVGVGAVVLGNIRVGKNIAIGANAVVNKSFDAEDIAIAGVPAKKVSNKGRTKWG